MSSCWAFINEKLLMKRLAIPLSNQKTVAKWLVMRSPELCCSRIQNAGSRSDELLCKLRFFILSRLVPASLATFFNTLFEGRLKE